MGILTTIREHYTGKNVGPQISLNFATAIGISLTLAGPSVCAQSVPTDEGAFTEYMAQALRQEVGDIPVSVKGPLTLSVGALQANLDRIYSFCKRNEAGCASEADRYTKGAAQVLKAQNAPIDRDAIRLVVRSAEYIKRAQASLGSDGPTLQFQPLVNGLVSVAVLDTPRAVRPLDERDLKKLDVSQEKLFEIGAKNLRNTLKPISETAKPVSSGQIGTLPASFYEVGRVAIHSDWEALANAQNGTLLIALPTTDLVLYISDSSPSAIDALGALARNTASRSSNPLSPAILKWTKEHWELVQ